MFYNSDGRLDPNGRFQLIDGVLKLRSNYVVKDGEHITFNMAFMDRALSGSSLLSDAERQYAVSRARSDHDLRYRYLPPSERPAFSADQQSQAIADAEAEKRGAGERQQVIARDEFSNPSFRHGIDVAQRAARKHVISNAWRG